MSGNATQQQPDVKDPTEVKTEVKESKGPDITAALARVAELEAKEAARIAADRKAEDDRKAQAQRDGDLKTQLELAQKEVERLKGIEADAQIGRSFREREEKRVADSLPKLSDEDRALVEQLPSVELKAKMVDRLLGATGTTPKSDKAPPAAASPGTSTVSFGSVTDLQELKKLKAAYPAEWEAFKAQLRGHESRQPTLIERNAAVAARR